MIIDYTCKFCGKPGKVDPGPDREGLFDLKKWIPILCCDRCGEFMERKRKIEDMIRRACFNLTAHRAMKRGEELSKLEGAICDTLTELTKRYAKLVCDYFSKTFVWDAEFVNMLMDSPTKNSAVIATYYRGIKRA